MQKTVMELLEQYIQFRHEVANEEVKKAKKEKDHLKKEKDPLKSKKPMSAFFLFTNDRRAALQIASEEWKNMTEEEKSPYERDCQEADGRVQHPLFHLFVLLILGRVVLWEETERIGCIDEAVEVFNQIRNRDVTMWTTMILGLGIHGRARDALQMFQEMEEEGVISSNVMFLAVLNAFSHGGMVDSGKKFFKMMVIEYRILSRTSLQRSLIGISEEMCRRGSKA